MGMTVDGDLAANLFGLFFRPGVVQDAIGFEQPMGFLKVTVRASAYDVQLKIKLVNHDSRIFSLGNPFDDRNHDAALVGDPDRLRTIVRSIETEAGPGKQYH